MARSRGRSSGRGGGGGRSGGGSQRSVKTAKRAAAPAEVEVVEEAGGASWADGVAVATFLALIVALIMLDADMGKNFGEGKLFGYEAEE